MFTKHKSILSLDLGSAMILMKLVPCRFPCWKTDLWGGDIKSGWGHAGWGLVEGHQVSCALGRDSCSSPGTSVSWLCTSLWGLSLSNIPLHSRRSWPDQTEAGTMPLGLQHCEPSKTTCFVKYPASGISSCNRKCSHTGPTPNMSYYIYANIPKSRSNKTKYRNMK